jgi:hypothetical protein
MPACGFTACEEEGGREVPQAVLREVGSGVVAVFCACGPGVFGSEAVADGYYG